MLSRRVYKSTACLVLSCQTTWSWIWDAHWILLGQRRIQWSIILSNVFCLAVVEVAVPILDMIKVGQSQSSRILTREGQKCARSHSGNVDRHAVRRDDAWRGIQGGKLMSWSRRVEGLCSRRAAYRGFQGSKAGVRPCAF